MGFLEDLHNHDEWDGTESYLNSGAYTSRVRPGVAVSIGMVETPNFASDYSQAEDFQAILQLARVTGRSAGALVIASTTALEGQSLVPPSS